MCGTSSDANGFDLAALLHASDLSPHARRIVFDVVVNDVIEGSIPDRRSVQELTDVAAGRISGDECRRRILDR
ncbi:hypothetical protein [Mycolicibacterium sp. CBMA 226]|uniref:antitoxin VbhA family protein n=1 Tax=Mycolicibacterium sp. CBMA 226 TaxID=2606611 RepID=UPI0014122FF7